MYITLNVFGDSTTTHCLYLSFDISNELNQDEFSKRISNTEASIFYAPFFENLSFKGFGIAPLVGFNLERTRYKFLGDKASAYQYFAGIDIQLPNYQNGLFLLHTHLQTNIFTLRGNAFVNAVNSSYRFNGFSSRLIVSPSLSYGKNSSLGPFISIEYERNNVAPPAFKSELLFNVGALWKI